MTITIRKYETVACPHCAAEVGQSCISKKLGQNLEKLNDKWRTRRGNYAHAERVKRYNKMNGPPPTWTGWPVGKLGT